jgi:predicted N-acetyltransferase YhbS
MEIRTLRKDERESLLALLDSWELPDGWRGRDFFRRYLELDPTYVDENVWVACDGAQLLSCVQIFPRVTRILEHDVPTGGIGSVFTHPEWRRSGLSGSLLERSAEDMLQRGMEISLLFTGLSSFYEKRGWNVYNSHRTVLRWSDRSAAASVASSQAVIAIERFRPEADLEEVREIHRAYSSGRTGTTARDTALWRASLELAGNPAEEFLVARVDGTIVAYLRATLLNDVFQVTELGRSDRGAPGLATLAVDLMREREPDHLVPPGKSSRELRSFVILPSFDDIPLTVALEQRGVASHPLEDPTAMLRCIDADALARRLDAARLPGEAADRFLQRILPPDGLVFWPADRF